MKRGEQRRRKRCADLGFTLLEVLVALSILGIAAAALFQVFSASLRAIDRSKEYTVLLIKADEKIRYVTAKDDLSEGYWQEMTPDGMRTDTTVANIFVDRTEAMNVYMVEITVTARWVRASKNRVVTLRTTKLVNRTPAQQQPSQGQES